MKLAMGILAMFLVLAESGEAQTNGGDCQGPISISSFLYAPFLPLLLLLLLVIIFPWIVLLTVVVLVVALVVVLLFGFSIMTQHGTPARPQRSPAPSLP